MRSAPLTTLKGGIDRLRTKGGARADSLYDLVNGHLTESRTAVARPGPRRLFSLDPTYTKGLVYFMGALYVVAEFQDGTVYHYWLQKAETWQADTVYSPGALVEPAVPNGLVYRATRLGSPYPSWAPGVRRSDGSGGSAYDQSIVEPTEYNGYYYVCIDTLGSNPVSGATEPTWPTERGALVVEDVDGGVSTSPTTTTPPSSSVPTPTETSRYGSYNKDRGRAAIP